MRRWVILGAVAAVLVTVLGWGVLQFDASRGGVPPAPSVAESDRAGWIGDGPGQAEPAFYGGVLDPPQQAPDFALIDQHGRPFRLRDHNGKVVVLFFGYTTCPDVCPGTMAHYRRVKERMGEDAGRVEFVFITVDPDRDTQERLAEYVAIFDPEFYGLTGPQEALEQVWKAYGVYAERVEAPDSPVGYWMNHTALSYVIDTEGNLRLAHLFGTPVEEVVADLQRLL